MPHVPREMNLLAVLALASLAGAQSVVVPGSAAATRGTSGLNTLVRDAGQPRTYMLGLAASQLSGIAVGEVLTGVSFRSYAGPANTASWPPTDTTFASYEIRIGAAIPLASWTGNFASNFSGAPQIVRSGALRIAAATYTNAAALLAPTPNAWGEFGFDFHSAFVYAGGDLGIYFTHGGSSIGSSYFLDVVPPSAPSGIVAYSQLAFRGTGGSAADACIVRVHHGFGASCVAASGRAPQLVSAGDLVGGGIARLGVGNGPAHQPGALLLGVGRTLIPIDASCSLLVLPQAVLPFALDAHGVHALAQAVPPGVLGTLDVQAAVVDPGLPTGLVLTNGVGFTAR
jgi:hypothetical protein